jgi:predicted ATP-grasp superfamily ATP-dependent carboligase
MTRNGNGHDLGVGVAVLRVLIHEWVTGGGLAGQPLAPSWAREGRAMRRALAGEFASAEGVEVVVTLDPRFATDDVPGRAVVVGPGGEGRMLFDLAAGCDFTLLIAPETGGVRTPASWR